MVTPLARRRPAKVARETATLDRLGGGCLTLGVGLAGDRYLPSTTPARRGTANNRSGTKRDSTVQRCPVVRDGLLAYPMTQ
jgi:hypothetical protein